MANLGAVLVLRGAGPLTGVARCLHRVTLGDRPFVSLDPTERVAEAVARAGNGMLCVDTRKLPHNIGAVIAAVRARDQRLRVVACADPDSAEPVIDLPSRLSRAATILIPPLAERLDELAGLLEAYSWDAASDLDASSPGLLPSDFEWIRASGVTTLGGLDDLARRLVAFRNWGSSGGARRLGIRPCSLSRWVHRRKIPA
jgi:hypothetical protein